MNFITKTCRWGLAITIYLVKKTPYILHIYFTDVPYTLKNGYIDYLERGDIYEFI